MKISLSWCGETFIFAEEETTTGQHISHLAGCAVGFIYPIYEMSGQKSDMERRSIRFQDSLLPLLSQELSLFQVANHFLSPLDAALQCTEVGNWAHERIRWWMTKEGGGRWRVYSAASPISLSEANISSFLKTDFCASSPQVDTWSHQAGNKQRVKELQVFDVYPAMAEKKTTTTHCSFHSIFKSFDYFTAPVYLLVQNGVLALCLKQSHQPGFHHNVRLPCGVVWRMKERNHTYEHIFGISCLSGVCVKKKKKVSVLVHTRRLDQS